MVKKIVKKAAPKKKVVEKKPATKKVVVKKAVVKNEVKDKVEVVVPAPKSPKPELPVVDNAQVVEILATGHTPTHYHCRCADGTTRHVLKSRFK